ncbi:hypothetical protein BY996DRAFT_6470074 [Phakopsora pachyrhizi]|nr:hypothetical protein BY996DRAFT_6470074 [Phakopsora pachyrhizi]
MRTPTWARQALRGTNVFFWDVDLGDGILRGIEHYWPEQKARKGWELAGLLPLSEDEDVGDQSDKTQLLKQITGDEEGIQHRWL